MAKWTPTGEGKIAEFGEILKPLDKYKAMTTVFSNIDNQAPVGPVHALAPGTWLSCVHPAISQEAHARDHGGPDRRAAHRPGHAAAFAGSRDGQPRRRRLLRSRLRLLLRGNDFLPHADHAAARWRPIRASCSSACSARATTRPSARGLSKQYVSLLDMVGEETKDLQRVLGPSDKAMLSDYLESVREIERRIQKMEARDLSKVDDPRRARRPRRYPFDQHINLMFDLVALAYQANMTRIFSFMMAAEVSGQTYNFIGVPDAFHPLSHHNNEQAKMERLAKVQTYHTQVFAKFLDKLAKMPDGDGTMLEHSLFLYGSNMSNSNAHNHYPLPTSIVGGWKTVKGGQHLVLPEHTPLANVLLTMLDRAGITQDKLGDSTGKLLEV